MLRFTVEAAIALAMAVTLFRAFFAEGYMISTGSMAPSLLGYHRQVCCPACEFRFARGAATEADSHGGTATASSDDRLLDETASVTARCPLCGTAVSEQHVPRTEGDQLMVHKHHYDWCDPERWEVVVFRNPQLPTQAYVKRVVGLPGETIELRDGDVYVDEVLQRKPLAVQRALRVPIDDSTYQPAADDPDWQPRWQAESSDSLWRTDGRQFRFHTPKKQTGAATIDWVHYRHWVRAGGRHLSRVPLADWPDEIAQPGQYAHGFRYDAEAHELEAVGAIPDRVRSEWCERVGRPDVRRALDNLYRASHQPLLSDVCAYNHPDSASVAYPVHDLMLELDLTAHARRGTLDFVLNDGCHELVGQLDLEAGVARILADDKPTIHREGPLPDELLNGEPVLLTVSQFDRQFIVAINEQPLFEPLLYAAEGRRAVLPEHPVKFGAQAADVTLSNIRLDRDIYYTQLDAQERTVCSLGSDEFFMLGDNSPVSLDSRAWEHPAVPRALLIGRPFVVHLPSKPRTIRWGDRELVLRVPDFSRVRYIR
ncbi:MAG: signal peptidase I [Planctomycetaceae bacterium]